MGLIKRRKLATKLTISFVIITMIAIVIGLVGWLNLKDIGDVKMVAATELLSLQEAYTEIAELDNLFLSQNVDYDKRQTIYLMLEEIRERIDRHKSNYLAVTPDENFDAIDDLMEAYMDDHKALMKIAKAIDDMRLDEPTALRFMLVSEENEHILWMMDIENHVADGQMLTNLLGDNDCALDEWLTTYETQSETLSQLIETLRINHEELHKSVADIHKILLSSDEDKLIQAREFLENDTRKKMDQFINDLHQIDVFAEKGELLYEEMTQQVLEVNRISHDISSRTLEEVVEKTVHDAHKEVVSATIMIWLFIVIGVILSLVLGLTMSNMIKKPIKVLLEAATGMAKGHLDIDIQINSKDELGELSVAFMEMASNINDVMSAINAASDQVASGSRQLSISSGSLSEDAVEQADSIQELKTSMDEIAGQINENASKAQHASGISDRLYDNALEGNQQMDNMLEAMTAIDDSSKSISNIIKVIDDIAFQTNILALNAAVEAARAGQHGKGFAIVAEEVRNLAAKSSQAAYETTCMIENSIKKVSDGTAIAEHTAEALSKIVDEVKRVSSLVEGIAKASKKQSENVDQINGGLVQISDVIQNTSATAEETAASSEELSEQADVLKSQVAKFRLKKYNDIAVSRDVMTMLDTFNKGHHTSFDDDSSFEKY